ncbi:MAG: glycogen/starch synthase [Flavobacteriales bacterium]|nr:glycogen/starch synthase [Flavobacteriales bacterium]
MSLKNAKVLTISQSIHPFMDGPEEMAKVARQLPQGILEQGNEIRVFMPKFGCINERRHQLHEVIRLSGMNLIINDTDHALLIKVASVPSARMQVYFIDNEEYFKRKSDTHCTEGEFHADNDERALFFGRGVLETVRKLGWVPDIIHCHGWMTAFVPLYVKHQFADDPHFENAKLVYSVYDQPSEALDKNLVKKLTMEGFDKDLLKGLAKPTTDELQKFAMGLSDGVVKASAKLSKGLETAVKGYERSVLLSHGAEGDMVQAHADFYHGVLEEALV